MRAAIRPRPRAGETLADYLQRTADLNLTSRDELGWPFRDDALRHHDLAWDDIAQATGRSIAELRDLTPFRYPPIVAGTGRPGSRNTRWRAAELRRWCPACGRRDCGGRRRDWDLLLTVCCRNCRRLLQPAADPDTYLVIPAGDTLLATQAAIEATLAATDSRRRRDQLGRLHRLVRIASLTADSQWPPTTSDYLSDLQRRSERRWEPWTVAHPPADPVTVAVLVTAGWEAMASRAHQQAFLTTAWDRIQVRGVELTRNQRASLPTIPPDPPQRQPNTTRTANLLGSMATELAAAGLTAANVPLMLTTHDEFLPPLHELRRRHHLAALLRAALAETLDNTASPSDDARDLRLGPHTTDDEAPTRGELRPYVDALLPGVGQPLVDYAHTRAALVNIPRSVLRETRLPESQWDVADAWIWTQHTRGPLLRGVHRVRLLDLVEFHRALDPERRLHLHQLGEQLLTWTRNLADQSTPMAGKPAAAEGDAGRRAG